MVGFGTLFPGAAGHDDPTACRASKFYFIENLYEENITHYFLEFTKTGSEVKVGQGRVGGKNST